MDKNSNKSVEDIDENIEAEAAQDLAPVETESVAEQAAEPQEQTAPPQEPAKKQRKSKKELSGAYWYTVKDNADLIKNSQIRSLVHVIALMLQLVVLALPQEGLEYVTKHISSYAFTYMWMVFIMIGVSIYVIIMDCVRNKIQKRIPVEKAPKNGFKKRAFLTAELAIAANALIFLFELTFVCIHYDGFGLLGMFITAAATGAAVWAREIEHLTLKDAERIEAPDEQSEENKQ